MEETGFRIENYLNSGIFRAARSHGPENMEMMGFRLMWVIFSFHLTWEISDQHSFSTW
jgi:hypothetical protein